MSAPAAEAGSAALVAWSIEGKSPFLPTVKEDEIGKEGKAAERAGSVRHDIPA